MSSLRLLLVLFALFLTACAPSNPMELVLHASSSTDFDIWQNSVLTRLEPKQKRWYQHAMEEFQLHAVTKWQGEGSATQHQKLIGELDGLKLREILIRGYELGLERRQDLLQDQRMLYLAHADLLNRPNISAEATGRVDDTMEQIARQISDLETEQEEQTKILSELNFSTLPASRSP